MKKITSFFLVLCLLLSLPSLSAYGEDALTWTLVQGGLLSIRGNGEMHDFDGDTAPWRSYESNIRELYIDYGVTHVGNQAFQYLTQLRAVYLPEGLMSIGYAAFYGCKELRFVLLPDDLEDLGVSSFDHCTSLTRVTLPEGLERIPNAAFNCCSELEEIYIPASVTVIEDSAFNSCSKLKTVLFGGSRSEWEDISIAAYNRALSKASVEFHADLSDHLYSNDIAFEPENGRWDWELSRNGVLEISGWGQISDYDGDLPPWGKQRDRVREIIVGEGISRIGDQAFQFCEKATKATLPDGLESIGYAAFFHCKALKEVLPPASLREIGKRAFEGCEALRSVRLPEGLTVIPENCFSGCSRLETVYIPSTVTKIEVGAFNVCPKLKDVYYAGSATDWSAISVGSYNRPLARAYLHTEGGEYGLIGGVV